MTAIRKQTESGKGVNQLRIQSRVEAKHLPNCSTPSNTISSNKRPNVLKRLKQTTEWLARTSLWLPRQALQLEVLYPQEIHLQIGCACVKMLKNGQERDCMQENWTNQLSNESKRTLWQNGKKNRRVPVTLVTDKSRVTLRPFLTPSPYSQHSQLSFSGDDIQLQDFQNPMNEYLWTTMRLTNHPPCWCSQTIPTTSLLTSLPTTTDQLFSPSIIVPYPARLVVQMKTTTHISTILGAPDLHR